VFTLLPVDTVNPIQTLKVPTLGQVAVWLGYVIDSLFTVLVLAEESHTLLDAINEIVLGYGALPSLAASAP
jgi:hypothetical protein